jgi:hypothetical protein
MNTLVIHPDDRSTDFLKPIYADIPCLVIKQNPGYLKLCDLINNHDRILMMGHGSGGGLFDINEFGRMNGWFINEKHALLLKNKENFYIWCHANQFVEKHKLKGFYTGMFISEVEEASFYNLGTTQEEINYSNNLFARSLAKIINNGPQILSEIKNVYSSEDCPIIKFNNERLRYVEII